LLPISAGFLLGIHFEPEDGGCRFFQIIGLSLNYTVLQPRLLLGCVQPCI
jgi:hypothetical protein